MDLDVKRPNNKSIREEEMNCWEFLKCETYASCPAYPNSGLDCWKKTGTKCSGGIMEKATIAEKILHCRNCEFFKKYAHQF